MNKPLAILLLSASLLACQQKAPVAESGPAPATEMAATQGPRQDGIRQVARDAYVYGFPMVESYKSMYQQAIDSRGPNFRAGFNKIGSLANVASPRDTAIITPNSDTPYSFLWMDLRAEPVVITLPAIDSKRYFSVQLIDMYTFNFAYINRALTQGKPGSYLIAGPDWKGETPSGIEKVFRSETQYAYGLFRTQLFAPNDLGNVGKLQAQYQARPLSAFLGTAPPSPAPKVDFPPYDAAKADGPGFFSYLDFLLQYAPAPASEAATRARFARIGIETGKPFDEAALSAQERKAITDGIADANKELQEFVATKINTHEVASTDLFGSREFLKNNYLYRFAGAKLGIFGNSGSEADYQSYFVDGTGKPLDAAAHDYALRFGKDQLPPTDAFWSVTMYDGKSKLLVDNPLDRYLINSPMLPRLKRDVDGGLTLYLQHASPGKDKESNWLPAPDGPFYAILRNYSPAASVVDRSWKKPELTASAVRTGAIQ